ncbi:MAG: 1-acyl-sn-glycerol-3-phosphate acyltransferase, partial [Bacteroidia bacterium]
KKYEPIVVPVVIDGFRRAFDKKGLRLKKKGVTLRVRIKPAMQLNLNQDAEHILHDMMEAIEQSAAYHWPKSAGEGSETK